MYNTAKQFLQNKFYKHYCNLCTNLYLYSYTYLDFLMHSLDYKQHHQYKGHITRCMISIMCQWHHMLCTEMYIQCKYDLQYQDKILKGMLNHMYQHLNLSNYYFYILNIQYYLGLYIINMHHCMMYIFWLPNFHKIVRRILLHMLMSFLINNNHQYMIDKQYLQHSCNIGKERRTLDNNWEDQVLQLLNLT